VRWHARVDDRSVEIVVGLRCARQRFRAVDVLVCDRKCASRAVIRKFFQKFFRERKPFTIHAIRDDRAFIAASAQRLAEFYASAKTAFFSLYFLFLSVCM
jgi:hypothetical protein